jgi:hypothetical protein
LRPSGDQYESCNLRKANTHLLVHDQGRHLGPEEYPSKTTRSKSREYFDFLASASVCCKYGISRLLPSFQHESLLTHSVIESEHL